MDRSRCFAWLADRLRKVTIINVIQAGISSGMVASTSSIAFAAMKFWPWIGGLFRCGEFWAGGAVGRIGG